MDATGWQLTAQRARVLTEEAALLTAGGRGPDADWLGAAAGWLAEVAPTWEAMAGSVPAARAYRRLYAGPALEAWLICWPAGGRLQLHDHGGASGALAVIDGVLHEESLSGAEVPGGLAAAPALRARTVRAGQRVAFDGRYIHDVRNPDAPVATSVHVYGAAVRPMAFYRRDGGRIMTVDVGEARSLVAAEIEAERDGTTLPEAAAAAVAEVEGRDRSASTSASVPTGR